MQAHISVEIKMAKMTRVLSTAADSAYAERGGGVRQRRGARQGAAAKREAEAAAMRETEATARREAEAAQLRAEAEVEERLGWTRERSLLDVSQVR